MQTDPTTIAQTETETGPRNSLVDSVANWLISQALKDSPMEDIFRNTCIRLHAAGIPIARAQVGFRILHPLFQSQTLTWRQNEAVEKNNYMHNIDRSAWYASPLYYMVQHDLPHFRRRLVGEEALLDFAILKEFRDQGHTDYVGFLIRFNDDAGEHFEQAGNPGIVGSWTSARETGFSENDIRALHRIEQRLAVALKINIQNQITSNILSAYLGPGAGRQVLEGRIQRGDGQTIRSVIWLSDMRNSTHLAETLGHQAFFSVLNRFFEATAGTVLEYGGEVLSFIGDAVLGIFPIEDDSTLKQTCCTAVTAALAARDKIDQWNHGPRQDDQPALNFGLGIHVGEVLFGNIGIPERLEFSVIGPAANEVARIESLTKERGCRVLISEQVARQLDKKEKADLTDAGRHSLRGRESPIRLFEVC